MECLNGVTIEESKYDFILIKRGKEEMVCSKDELRQYIEMDAEALEINPKKCFWGNEVWRFQKSLRLYEYALNTHKSKLVKLYRKVIYRYWMMKLGFVILPNVFGGGLRINHFGNIVVNSEAKIGEWCDIHQGVNIGTDFEGAKIGDPVWIGPGAKLYGNIRIASGCAIGANAVVNKSFNERATIVGVPAYAINSKGNCYYDES